MIVRELLTRLGFNVDEAGADKYERRFSSLQQHAVTLQNSLGGILGAIGVGMGFAFFKDVTSEFTDLESRLANNLGADQAAAAMGRLNEIALLTYQSTRQVVDGYISMKSGLDALNVSTDDQLVLQQSIADSFTATGVKGEVAARAMMWLNRVFMKGKVSNEELNGLLESSDDLLQMFAQDLGVSVQGLKDMAEAGKVSSSMFVKFFQKNTNKFRELSESMPVTINDAIMRITERFRYFIYQSDKATGASAWIAKALLVVADNVEILAGVVAALLIPGLMAIAVWVGTVTTAFFGLAAALLANPITWIVVGLVALALAIQDVYKWVTGGKSVIGEWLGPWEDVTSRVKTLWSDFLSWIAAKWDEFRAAGAGAIDGAISAIYNVLEAAIKDPWHTLWTMTLPGMIQAAAPELFSSLKDAFTAVLDWMGTKWKSFWDTASHPIQSLKNWWNSETSAPAAAAPQPRSGEFEGARASGGPVSRGKTYMVGEEGPEPFIPSRSGWVLPHGLLDTLNRAPAPPSAHGGNMSASFDVNVNVQGSPGQSESDARAQGRTIGTEVRRAIRDELRSVFASTAPSFPEAT